MGLDPLCRHALGSPNYAPKYKMYRFAPTTYKENRLVQLLIMSIIFILNKDVDKTMTPAMFLWII